MKKRTLLIGASVLITIQIGNWWASKLPVGGLTTEDLQKTVGEPIKIDNLLIAQHRVHKWIGKKKPKRYDQVLQWETANRVCKVLGKGWRLPTKDEFAIIYENRNIISGFNEFDSYWSSTKDPDDEDNDNVFVYSKMNNSDDYQSGDMQSVHIGNKEYVLAVKDI